MLTERQSRILELVISEYVDGAEPVASQLITRRYDLGVSSATIRHEMAELEREGYLDHPHTSSGRVPTDKGYRFFVQRLMREEQLPWEDQQTIRHQFHQVEGGQEAWAHLAASVLARAADNAAVVTAPRTATCRLKHLELVSLHDRTVLLVLVLDQGVLRQQILSFEDAYTQEELSGAAQLLNQAFTGKARGELDLDAVDHTPLTDAVMEQVTEVMSAVDAGGFDEAYLDGVRQLLSQPEFSRGEQMLGLLELLDERNLTRAIPLRALAQDGVTVIIGADNPRLDVANDAMRACSVVVGAYGAPGVASGALAVLGPMRMRYSRTISTVRYLSGVMSDLLAESYE